ncbi:extracellular solute-binding protein [Streptomyces sp. 3MP-14]|uniref:Extracellular solute-binding protein n=1 Tax=Streptomyces mimosae TaxID=2586635 RepID=A0A5N6ADX0_9ACTN|nr:MULTISPECIES: extracellular solute-binding protein [Streptomyces]KAB8165698.1 extracellular solute-binding protein [Streptomyces mimosae]KAB8176087.1 extracellular solute-binding protein [Streptomyces sp. 3MP-14]
MSTRPLSRRTLLAGLGLGAATLGLGPLTACSSGARSGRNSAQANSAVALPRYLPFEGVAPDLPGDETSGVLPGFLHYPTDNPRSVAERPGNGETVSGLANLYTAVPPGVDRNSYWRGLNERLGVTLDMRMVPNADYEQTFSITMASGDLPDVMQLWPGANFADMLHNTFAPLDEFLGGDAAGDYPNLANIPTAHWKNCVFNGALYAVPVPRGRVRHYHLYRRDLFEAIGVDGEPRGWDEFVALCQELTDPSRRRWALGSVTQAFYFLARMNDEPNVWREEGGNLTHFYETEEYRQSVQDMTALWDAGVIHPDTFNPSTPFAQYFGAGTVAMSLGDGYGAWSTVTLANDSEDFALGLMPVYDRAGGELAAWHTGNGVFNIAGLRKQDDPEKTRLVLRVLDWLAAPFGTEEHLYRVYGEEGVDHERNADGDPIYTSDGQTNTGVPTRYLVDSPAVLYQPGRPDDVEYQHAYQTTVLERRKDDPTLGLHAESATARAEAAERNLLSTRDDVIQGRRSLSDLDRAVDDWRSAIGDQMRTEFEEQLQQAG